ncbi:hypothetical protein GF1_32310 [Desulfolithobacter dissulfuricans]|uniref:Uncharacterized protein n=1 Tax=Desulfolithobacter dissulfuricans TaxID=2795293 RepID=A0A915XJW5_9BACT|nr:hypothetical protein [Desulfolithobacter dissulfuricans]BCO10855.1 hypothetical protein GF1_32310 [Desulfolithobacter dissulfuricans]
MKNNTLRAPLIKAGVVLGIFALLVYFTSTSAEGSVWNSLGSIIVFLFRTVQLAVGLALSLLICLAVLIGIFLGAVALVNRDGARRMYEALVETVGRWLQPCTGLLRRDRAAELEARLESFGQELKTELSSGLNRTARELREAQEVLENKLQSLVSRLRDMEEKAEQKAGADQVEELAATVADSGETLAKLDQAIARIEAEVKKAMDQVQAVSPDSLLGDLPARIEALESQEGSGVEEKIVALQEEIVAIRRGLDETMSAVQVITSRVEAGPAAGGDESGSGNGGEEEHRLFSYFEDPADRAKLAELVGSTLKKDMTYSQVMEFIGQEMGPEAARIISEHPSLTKDYIRQRRRSA